MILDILLFVVMFVVLAMMWPEGFWSNALTLVNVVFAGTIACNYFEPLADYFDSQMPSLTYAWDFIALWAVFSFSFLILRTVAEQTSQHKVRFRLPVEMTGRILASLLTGWVFICFITFSLHIAPLARSPLRGSFEPQPMAANFLFLKPDRYWLGYLYTRSRGVLARNPPQVFDAEGDFIFKYAARRDALQKYNQREGKISVGKR